MPSVIAADGFAGVLRFSRGGLLRGACRDVLPVGYLNGLRVFTFEEADQFILGCVRNGATPPSAYDLLMSHKKGEDLIITPKEAAVILGRREHTLCNSRTVGSQPYLQIGKSIRYVKSEIVAEAEGREKKLDSRDLEKILCVSQPTLVQLIDAGLVKVHRKGPKAIRYEADRAHLLKQLREWLPPYVNPEAWITMQLEATEPAVSFKQIGLYKTTIIRRLREFELPYIQIERSQWSLPAETARAVVANHMPAMEVAEIARLFDVTTKKADAWVQQKALICSMHTAQHAKCLRPPCLRRYIQSYGVTDCWQWYRRRMDQKEGLYAIARLGTPYIAAIEAGELEGVRLPGERGGWRFLHGDIQRFANTHKF